MLFFCTRFLDTQSFSQIPCFPESLTSSAKVIFSVVLNCSKSRGPVMRFLLSCQVESFRDGEQSYLKNVVKYFESQNGTIWL